MTFAAAPPRIAEHMGLFAKHGLRRSSSPWTSGSGATTALISGSVEAIVGGPGEHVAAAARGQEIVAIANLYQGLGGSLALSNAAVEKTGISPDAPAEERLKALDGLLIGSSSATSSYTVAVKSAAEAVGATVRFTYMPQTTTPTATETGAIDGFMASAPVWSIPVDQGHGRALAERSRRRLPPGIRAGKLHQHPDDAQRRRGRSRARHGAGRRSSPISWRRSRSARRRSSRRWPSSIPSSPPRPSICSMRRIAGLEGASPHRPRTWRMRSPS